MKTYILTLSVFILSLLSGSVYAQNFDDLYSKYQNEDNIISMRLNKFGCLFASLFGDSESETQQFFKNSSGVRVLINQKANNHLKKDLQRFIKKDNLEQLVSVNEKESYVDVYVQDEKKTIRQLLIIISGKEEQLVLHLDGEFPLEMIKKMVNKRNTATIIKANFK